MSRVSRNRNSMVAVSDDFAFGLSTDAIVTQYTVDSFDDTRHTFTPRIMVGASVISPATTEVTIDPANPNRRTYISTYALGSPTTSARMRVAANTTNVVSVPFVQDAFISAL